MAELAVTVGGTPSHWWAEDPTDVLTVVSVLERRAQAQGRT